MAQLMTTRQLAEQLTVTPETVRRWVKLGMVKPAFKTPGGQMRFDLGAVRGMLEGETMTPRARLIRDHVSAARSKVFRLYRNGEERS